MNYKITSLTRKFTKFEEIILRLQEDKILSNLNLLNFSPHLYSIFAL